MNSFEEFCDRLKPALATLIQAPMNKETLSRLQSALASRFYESKATGEILMPYDGMQIVGGVGTYKRNSITIGWVTEFFPAPRFGMQPGEYMPLGFFGEFDLYVGMQSPLPPTLIARHGHAPNDYETFNPSWQGAENAYLHGEHFVEALERAMFIGCDLHPV